MGQTGTRRSRDIDVTSKNIDGISDLVVWAPIRDGFIEAFNNVTYETRLRLVGEALHSLRKSAREHEKLEPFADTAKRILSLLDFRIGIVDRDLMGPVGSGGAAEARTFRPRKYMYLVATFSGPWEPYMRLIYKPLGTFLDLVLCNCEGYPPTLTTDFETYAQWVRDHQLDSAIFYATSGLTVGDMMYLQDVDRIQRTRTATQAADEISRLSFKLPDEIAREIRETPENVAESVKLGLEALNVLYKLTDFYPPNGDEGVFLHHAAQDLLRGLPQLLGALEASGHAFPETLKPPLKWFSHSRESKRLDASFPEFDPTQIQKGVLSPFDGPDFQVTHGALLLVRVDVPDRARSFMRQFKFSWESDDRPKELCKAKGVLRYFATIAFSAGGLEKLGVPERERAAFPKEFREGMADRAPLLGDKYDNHPRKWRLPPRSAPFGEAAPPGRVELSEVDFVLSLRAQVDRLIPDVSIDFAKMGKPFCRAVEAYLARTENQNLETLLSAGLKVANSDEAFAVLVALLQGVGPAFGFTVLGVENMIRSHTGNDPPGQPPSTNMLTPNKDHFGFSDGISQPIIRAGPDIPGETDHPLTVLHGDIICGHANSRSDVPHRRQKKQLLFNGTFLVVRKIQQNIVQFRQLESDMRASGLDAALLVGRTKVGGPLVDPSATGNGFTYDNDPEGDACPLSAHIRLANPRTSFHGRPAPKIVRRGMSYGPRSDDVTAQNEPRGIIFMAYCASLAEQYEVIQRWLNGGNATGVCASRNDPLTGARDRSETEGHIFTCRANGKAHQIRINKPLTRLQWGSYFFVPSRAGLKRIANADSDRLFKAQRLDENQQRVNDGYRIIRELERLPQALQQEEWKKIIEDFLTKDPTEQDKTPRVWQAIDDMGGAYRVESGIAFDRGSDRADSQNVILVTDERLILDVLGEGRKYPNGTFSSSTQFERINQGFGAIYVCRDAGEAYDWEATKTNQVLMRYSRRSAVRAGYRAGRTVLKPLASEPSRPFKLELGRQFIHPALGELSRAWYGIPDGTFFEAGSWDWDADRAPVCPGDFLATSRHTFYPRPTSTIRAYGKKHGQYLNKNGAAYVRSVWQQDPRSNPIEGSIACQIHQIMHDEDAANPGHTEKYQDLMLRNIIGGMVGAIPPMDSCLRWTLFDWLREETLWRHQSNFREQLIEQAKGSVPDTVRYENAVVKIATTTLEPGLKTAMCVRPAPDLLYRVVTADGVQIGGLKLRKNDLVVLCLSAATQSGLARGNNDVSIVFGGNRKTKSGKPKAGSGLHSCPAKDLAMGAMTGILAALLDSGTIEALPASLIVEITGQDQPIS